MTVKMKYTIGELLPTLKGNYVRVTDGEVGSKLFFGGKGFCWVKEVNKMSDFKNPLNDKDRADTNRVARRLMLALKSRNSSLGMPYRLAASSRRPPWAGTASVRVPVPSSSVKRSSTRDAGSIFSARAGAHAVAEGVLDFFHFCYIIADFDQLRGGITAGHHQLH